MPKLYSVLLSGLLVLFMSASMAAAQTGDAQPSLDEEIYYLQTEWARIRYDVPDHDAKIEQYEELGEYAAKVTETFPDSAEPKIWEGIILSTAAGEKGGLSALGLVSRSRKLLEQALAIDETALQGSAHTSLGSLYYQVPGWPLSFGSNSKAEEHLKAALGINPDGIDPNYFYGDYLRSVKRYDQAEAVLEHALEAAPRPGRELADSGRREEIETVLIEVRDHLATASAK